MPSLVGTEVAQKRARVAVATRVGTPAERENARRELAAANIAAYIERVVSTAPPLTAEQRDRLAVLIRGGGAG